MRALITGTAGFIGFHTVNRFLADGWEVVGFDSINDYYDVNLKYGRLAAAGISQSTIQWNEPSQSSLHAGYTFYRLRLEDKTGLKALFDRYPPFDVVVNLAAQAGVRYSLSNPQVYAESNIMGFLNLLECCRHHQAKHLVYASSSSVYGLNETIPFHENHPTDHPISLYAASKKSNELMAHTYSHLFGLPTTGLRFFTVYGPWGRPDMALFSFTKAIFEGKAIDVYNQGEMYRDFTYVDDIVQGIASVATILPQPNPAWNAKEPVASTSTAPYRLYNVGNSKPVRLLEFIEAIESKTGKRAIKNLLPIQPGDVPATFASVENLQQAVDYYPKTSVEEGVGQFVSWYKKYYSV